MMIQRYTVAGVIRKETQEVGELRYTAEVTDTSVTPDRYGSWVYAQDYLERERELLERITDLENENIRLEGILDSSHEQLAGEDI